MREFRKTLKDKTWRWRIHLDGNHIHTECGFVGGTLETFIDPVASKYRGANCEIHASTAAATKASKMIKDKLRSGFEEVDPETGKVKGEMELEQLERWDELPSAFRTYRTSSLNEYRCYHQTDFNKMIAADQALIYVFPGGRHFTFMMTAEGRARVYSTRGEEYTQRVPHLIRSLEQAKLPPKSMFTAWLTTGEAGNDRLLFLSKTTDAMVNRQLAPDNRLYGIVHDVFFWDGEDVISNRTRRANRNLSKQLFPSTAYFSQLEQLSATFEGAKKYAQRQKLPGILVYDPLNKPKQNECFNFHGSGPYSRVWLWRRGLEAEFYLFYHPSMGGRTGVVHRRNRSEELCLGKVGLFQASPDGEPQCFGTVRHGFSREQEQHVLEQAQKHKGWVGRAQVRFIGYHEPAHSEVISRLIDPYFLRFLPPDSHLESFRRLALVPGLGTVLDREQRAALKSSSQAERCPRTPSAGDPPSVGPLD